VAELSASWSRVRRQVAQLGRKSLEAEVLAYLADSDDPLPEETAVIKPPAPKTTTSRPSSTPI
jgi:hypothetical protein